MSEVLKINWYGDRAKDVILKNAMNRIEAAAIHYQNALKANISTPSTSSKRSKLGKAIKAIKSGGTP